LRSDGLGLGLYVVKRAAELLQHQIEVRSTVGRGSCFTVLANASGYAWQPRGGGLG
jgi:signal transduction histidine kinase